jgi:hypothetical protein
MIVVYEMLAACHTFGIHMFYTCISRSRSYFTTDSQSVCLGIEYPCGTCDQILLPVGMLLSEICGFVSGAPSLTRGWVYIFQCNHSMVRVAQNP